MIESPRQMSTPNTMLILDVDQSITRTVLCDVVEGSARLVDVGEAMTTAGSPFLDMSIGINRALRQLEDQTGRRLLDGDSIISPAQPDGDGVDRLFVTGVPLTPNRIGLLSLEHGHITHVIRTAARRSLSIVSDADTYFRWAETTYSPTAIEGWLRDAQPNTVILIAGQSSNDDWRAALEVVAGTAPIYGGTSGVIIGNEEQQQIAAETLEDSLELSGIDPSAYELGEISSAIESELREQYAGRLPDEDSLQAFSSGMFLDRIQAIESVAAFLHRRMGRRLAVMGMQSGTFIEIAAQYGALTVYRGDLDLGANASTLLQLPMRDIAHWVPSQMTEDEVRHWLLNRSLRPQVRIFGPLDRQIASAASRELVRNVAISAGADEQLDIDLVVLGREFLDTFGENTVLVALDALQILPSEGVVMLSIDRDGIIAALGALSAGEPDYAREVIENDFLSPLASCVVFGGPAQAGNRIADVEVVTDNDERHEFSITSGEMRCIQLPEGQTARVTITPVNGVSVGRHQAGEVVSFTGDYALHGGQLGIVFDGRGRPINLPNDNETRIHLLDGWANAFSGESG
jgi:hypothetical protein